MPDSEIEWKHAGMSKVNDGRIRVPDMVFEEAEILTIEQPVYWSYETTVKILIVSNQPLKDDEYETEDFTKLGDEDDNYRCTIPSAFFEEGEERGKPAVSRTVPEKARVTNGERRHFMFNSEMAQDDTRSCYVLTDQEFSDRFKYTDLWKGTLDQVPQFL